MKAILEDGEKIGECEHCGDEGRVFIDNNSCEECDGQFFMCSVCKEEQHRDNTCRHLFQGLDDYEWKGSGAWIDPELKVPLFALFSRMPEGFVPALRVAIKSGKFYTFLMAPMIGSGGHMELGGIEDWRFGVAMI